MVRDQARKSAPKTKPVVDADGFQVQTKRGSAHKTVQTATSSLCSSCSHKLWQRSCIQTPVKTVTPVKPSTVKAKGAWAAGAPKTKPVEVRPHQEIRPPVPKAEAKIAPKPQAVQYMYPIHRWKLCGRGGIEAKSFQDGLSCWADDDDEELD